MSCPSLGLMANWQLDPPHSTPISRMMASEASRRRWYSLSVSVCAGATVMESPVCTPMGSMFSIEHTIMQLSLRSRITSSSYSFQPSRDISTSTCFVADAASPDLTICSNSSGLYAMPPPVPPRVNAGRIIRGYCPMSAAISHACSMDSAVPDLGVARPILVMAFLNRSRSSALLMASNLAPISSTLYLSRIPASARSLAKLSAVCPPMVGRMASGRSFSMIFSTSAGVIGVI
mmetsp:Transcript_35410/g.67754  ORF Transcript_35410/g.67754 Transcript_35410/m.67754 type:complete len:233 (-) Transcript_35410:577-1275(-)